MTFGEKLQDLRRKAGMSQDALAEKLEVSRQAVSKWERDEAMPETEKVLRIAKLFGVSLDELLLDKQPEPRQEPPRYQPAYQPSGARVEKILRRHGYKFGYVLMAVGALICAFAILMRLAWPALAGNFFDAATPDSFGAPQWEIQFEGDLSESEKQMIMEGLEAELGTGGMFGSAMPEMNDLLDGVVNAQANLFLIGLLPGLTLLGAGLLIVIKGKKLAEREG